MGGAGPAASIGSKRQFATHLHFRTLDMTSSDKRHYVFSLTSAGRDAYSLMTRAAIVSLRDSNPNAWITLACDTVSHARLESTSDPVLADADAILPIQAHRSEASFRSRFVKTSIGHSIAGPFLFLDADTLVRRHLGSLDAHTAGADIAVAANNCGEDLASQLPSGSTEILARNGWRPPAAGYYNSGVIWFGGTPASHEFSREWHRRWLQSSAAGDHYDQPAFNAVLADSDLSFRELPLTYNAQFKRKPSVATEAAIWHYFASFRQSPAAARDGFRAITEIENYLFGSLRGTEMDPARVLEIARRPFPWIQRSKIDRIIVGQLCKQHHSLSKAAVFWLQGRRAKAIRRWITQTISAA
jgi:hypothetical protein